jgi:hypothetical protein
MAHMSTRARSIITLAPAGKHSGERSAVGAILGGGFAGGSMIYARHKIEDNPRRNMFP